MKARAVLHRHLRSVPPYNSVKSIGFLFDLVMLSESALGWYWQGPSLMLLKRRPHISWRTCQKTPLSVHWMILVFLPLMQAFAYLIVFRGAALNILRLTLPAGECFLVWKNLCSKEMSLGYVAHIL